MINKYNKISPKGFTLIEHIFSVIILGFMLTITLTTFIGVFRFYEWSSTTRVNQSSARQVMDLMTREIASRSIAAANDQVADSLCLTPGYSSSNNTSEKISLNDFKIILTQYSGSTDCSSTESSQSVLSNASLQVRALSFKAVLQSVNSAYQTSKPAYFHKSVVINMTEVNGVRDPVTNKCRAGDVFCDTADFTTATTERR